MKTPVLVINFKTYRKGTGDEALRLAKACQQVSKETGKNIIAAVQTADILRISEEVDIPVFSQHIDPIEYGANTGHILPESLKQSGASGCIINHSEDQMNLIKIESCINKAKKLGLETIVCAPVPQLAKEIARYNPDCVAIEPPEFIGTETSVSDAEPEIIKETVDRIKDIPVLCGAGIKDKHDVRVAIELGAKGVLVASHIVKADDQRAEIMKLLEGF